jgi:hypothetical protein
MLQHEFSRRCVLKMVVLMQPREFEAGNSDDELIALSQELDSIPAKLDRCADPNQVIELLDLSDQSCAKIATIQATTVHGLIAKARATAWALYPDFDPMNETSNHMRIVASIVRDLLRAAPAPPAFLK